MTTCVPVTQRGFEEPGCITPRRDLWTQGTTFQEIRWCQNEGQEGKKSTDQFQFHTLCASVAFDFIVNVKHTSNWLFWSVRKTVNAFLLLLLSFVLSNTVLVFVFKKKKKKVIHLCRLNWVHGNARCKDLFLLLLNLYPLDLWKHLFENLIPPDKLFAVV